MDASRLTELIAGAQRREPDAFDALVDAYSARLYGYFYRRTGSRHDAEDLLQEVFVRVVRTIERYTHDGRFEAWLFRIAANLIRDRVRRSQRSGDLGRGVGGDSDEVLSDRPDGSADEPAEVVSRAEQCDRLQDALGQLPEPERDVILLRHFSHLSFKEVAQVMGTPLGTALARAHRGLARLRELMEETVDVRNEK